MPKEGLTDDLFARYGVSTTGKGARGFAAAAPAAHQPSLAEAAPVEASRGFGGLAGSRSGPPPGFTAPLHAARATAAGERLGEPTSYAGGAGAPAGIPVMRGTATTVQPVHTGPGGQFDLGEVATAAQARQAYNQAIGRGEWRPSGLTAEEVKGQYAIKAHEAYGRAIKPQAEANVIEDQRKRAQAEHEVTRMGELLGPKHGTFDSGKGKMVFKPQTPEHAIDLAASENIARQFGAEAADRHFDERQDIRKWLVGQALPKGTDISAYINARAMNPALWQSMVTQARAWLASGAGDRTQSHGIASWRLPTTMPGFLEEPPLGP